MAEKVFNQKTSYGLAVLSGILLFLSFPPFSLGGFLAWFALVPLLIAVYNETKVKRIERLVSVTGICLAPVFVWLYNEFDFFLPSIVAWPLGIISAFFVGYFVVFYVEDYWKPKQLPPKELTYLPPALQILLIPIVGTATEFLAMSLPVVMKVGGAFGFFSISRTQWLNVPILQLASFTGMYGITFLILLVNCAVAHTIIHYKERKRVSKQAIAVLLIAGMVFVYGLASIPDVSVGDINVVIIQAKPEVIETQRINELYADLSEYSLKYEPDIILWSIWMGMEPTETGGPCADRYVSFCEDHDVYLTDGDSVVCPDGRVERYPGPYLFIYVFDGFVPFDPSKILPKIHGFDTRFGELGILLCMESASTIPARQLVEGGTQFIVVTSGDRPVIGAFQGLIGGNVVYRAVEHRIFTALFFGSGGSIIVDPYGRIIEDIAPEEEIVAGKVSFTNERTFYSKYGDVFGWSIVGLALVLVGYNSYLKGKSPFGYCEKCRAKIEKVAAFCDKCGASQEKPPLWKRILLHEYYEHIKK